MILECTHCGAPLDVREGVAVTKCRYCSASSETRAMRTVVDRTPDDWQPPRRWTPPAHVPADSTRALDYDFPGAKASAQRTTLIVGAVGAAAVVGLVAAALLVRSPSERSGASRALEGPAAGGDYAGAADGSRHAASELAALSMHVSKAALAAKFAVKADENSVRVPLLGSACDAVTFEWDPSDPNHVSRFYLTCATPFADCARVKKRLETLLPPRWNGDTWQWQGVSIYFAEKGGMLGTSESIPTEPRTDRPWRDQVETLWSIISHAVLDRKPEHPDLEAKAVRDYLGGGGPLTELGKIDFDVDGDGDGATAAVRAVEAGAVKKKLIGLDFVDAIDHRYFGEATMQWKNAKGGKVVQVDVRPIGSTGLFSDQPAIAACVAEAFDVKARVYEGDYLAKDRDFNFALKGGGEIRVYQHMIAITVRDSPFSAPMPIATWLKTLKVLDACGREKR